MDYSVNCDGCGLFLQNDRYLGPRETAVQLHESQVSYALQVAHWQVHDGKHFCTQCREARPCFLCGRLIKDWDSAACRKAAESCNFACCVHGGYVRASKLRTKEIKEVVYEPFFFGLTDDDGYE